MGLNLFYTFIGLVVGLMICIPIWFYIIDKFTTHLVKKTERNIIKAKSNKGIIMQDVNNNDDTECDKIYDLN